jgi:hypothetical protein
MRAVRCQGVPHCCQHHPFTLPFFSTFGLEESPTSRTPQQHVVTFLGRAADLDLAIPQFHHSRPFGPYRSRAGSSNVHRSATGNPAAAANSVPPSATRRSLHHAMNRCRLRCRRPQSQARQTATITAAFAEAGSSDWRKIGRPATHPHGRRPADPTHILR